MAGGDAISAGNTVSSEMLLCSTFVASCQMFDTLCRPADPCMQQLRLPTLQLQQVATHSCHDQGMLQKKAAIASQTLLGTLDKCLHAGLPGGPQAPATLSGQLCCVALSYEC